MSGKSILDAIQDTEAFVAANDDMIAVVFRGTKELTDWTTNLKFALRSVPDEWNVEEGCDMHRVRELSLSVFRSCFPLPCSAPPCQGVASLFSSLV